MVDMGEYGVVRRGDVLYDGTMESHPQPVSWMGEAEDPANSRMSCPTTARRGCWLGQVYDPRYATDKTTRKEAHLRRPSKIVYLQRGALATLDLSQRRLANCT